MDASATVDELLDETEARLHALYGRHVINQSIDRSGNQFYHLIHLNRKNAAYLQLIALHFTGLATWSGWTLPTGCASEGAT